VTLQEIRSCRDVCCSATSTFAGVFVCAIGPAGVRAAIEDRPSVVLIGAGILDHAAQALEFLPRQKGLRSLCGGQPGSVAKYRSMSTLFLAANTYGYHSHARAIHWKAWQFWCRRLNATRVSRTTLVVLTDGSMRKNSFCL
jgi:hypothetical protein